MMFSIGAMHSQILHGLNTKRRDRMVQGTSVLATSSESPSRVRFTKCLHILGAVTTLLPSAHL